MSDTYSVTAFAAIAALAFAASAVLTLRLARAGLVLDRPNERSLHDTPVPRTGGVAVLGALASAWALSLSVLPLVPVCGWLVAAILVVASVSFLDDRGEVKPGYRLAAHLAAAVLLLAGGIAVTRFELPTLVLAIPEWLTLVLTLLSVVWMINLYNFMDGMDGFAGGMAVFGFGTLAVVGWQAGDAAYALGNTVVAAAAGGFLVGNFPPARIFLGDVGSATLGLLAAASALMGAERGLFPLWIAGLAFSPFIVDATWTLIRRLVRGERVWEPHRTHLYQRLVLAGWSQRKTLLWSYLLMAACGATAVAACRMPETDQGLLLAGWAVVYVLIGLRVRLTERAARAVAT